MDNKVFLNVKDILARDKLVNLIAGARGIGKTYSALLEAKDNYEATGRTTLYLRRFKTELKKFDTNFDPLFLNKDIDPDIYKVDPVTKKKLFDIKDGKNKVVVEAVALTQGVNFKSSSFSNCNLVIFDEFILDKGTTLHYLPDEFNAFHNYIETIARLGELTEGRIVKVLMLANAGNRNNPYFIGYNIPIMKNELYINDDLLCYMPNSQNFKKEKEKTRWGKFVKKHTQMESYMMDGNFNDKNDFISKLPSKTRYIATLKYLDKKIGVYIALNDTKCYISDKYNNNFTVCYALTQDDSTPNYLLLSDKNPLLEYLKKYWICGQLRFTDVKIQAIFLEILKLL